MSEFDNGAYFHIAMTQISHVMERRAVKTALETDLAIVEAAATGERAARRRLLYRVMPRVEKTVQFLTKGNADTEDLIQLALLEIVRAAPSFRGDASLDYWTDRVVIQTAAKQFQRQRRREQIFNNYWMPPPSSASVDELVAEKEVRDRLIDTFGKLKEPLRVPVALHYLYGYEVTEIADLMSIKVNTVRGRLRTGMAKLRKLVLSDPALVEWIDGEMR